MTSPMTAKTIRSLREKKYRENTKRFLVEGEKNVLELLKSDFKIEYVCATKEFKKKYNLELENINVNTVDASELVSYGTLEMNQSALAVVFQKPIEKINLDEGITLVLDDIRDPGNLGTIIRIADWYGIKNIVCSLNTTDWMNPKTINGTMGSFTRVNISYTDLPSFLQKQKFTKIGTFMNGDSVHTFSFPKKGILVIGSESHGISKEVAKQITVKVTIPSFGKAESLNAGVATGIVLDRWKGGIQS